MVICGHIYQTINLCRKEACNTYNLTGVDRLAAWVVIGLIVLIYSSYSQYGACAAASEADDITEEWNKNWTGQKVQKIIFVNRV